MSTALTKTDTNVAPLHGRKFSPDQVDLIKRTIAKGATDDELKLFMYQCERTGLDPLARQIYAVKRRQFDTEQDRWIDVMGIQTSIDGFRLVAQRSGEYGGQEGPFWCGHDGVWLDVWLSTEPPVSAKVGVWRTGFKQPCWGVARFTAYAQRKKGGELNRMWASMGDVMIAKCAEALALRKAFPQELSGLYTSDEMEQATPAKDDESPTPREADVATRLADAAAFTAAGKGNNKAAVPDHDPQTGEVGPHTIIVPRKDNKDDYVGWGSLFVAACKAAKDAVEVNQWLELNKATLEYVEKQSKMEKLNLRIRAAISAAWPKHDFWMPSLEKDPEAFLAWLKKQLAACADVTDVADIKKRIAPQLKGAFPSDVGNVNDMISRCLAALEKDK